MSDIDTIGIIQTIMSLLMPGGQQSRNLPVFGSGYGAYQTSYQEPMVQSLMRNWFAPNMPYNVPQGQSPSDFHTIRERSMDERMIAGLIKRDQPSMGASSLYSLLRVAYQEKSQEAIKFLNSSPTLKNSLDWAYNFIAGPGIEQQRTQVGIGSYRANAGTYFRGTNGGLQLGMGIQDSVDFSKQLMGIGYDDQFGHKKRFRNLNLEGIGEVAQLAQKYGAGSKNTDQMISATKSLAGTIDLAMGVFETLDKEGVIEKIMDMTRGSVDIMNTGTMNTIINKVQSMAKATNMNIQVMSQIISEGNKVLGQMGLPGLAGTHLGIEIAGSIKASTSGATSIFNSKQLALMGGPEKIREVATETLGRTLGQSAQGGYYGFLYGVAETQAQRDALMSDFASGKNLSAGSILNWKEKNVKKLMSEGRSASEAIAETNGYVNRMTQEGKEKFIPGMIDKDKGQFLQYSYRNQLRSNTTINFDKWLKRFNDAKDPKEKASIRQAMIDQYSSVIGSEEANILVPLAIEKIDPQIALDREKIETMNYFGNLEKPGGKLFDPVRDFFSGNSGGAGIGDVVADIYRNQFKGMDTRGMNSADMKKMFDMVKKDKAAVANMTDEDKKNVPSRLWGSDAGAFDWLSNTATKEQYKLTRGIFGNTFLTRAALMQGGDVDKFMNEYENGKGILSDAEVGKIGEKMQGKTFVDFKRALNEAKVQIDPSKEYEAYADYIKKGSNMSDMNTYTKSAVKMLREGQKNKLVYLPDSTEFSRIYDGITTEAMDRLVERKVAEELEPARQAEDNLMNLSTWKMDMNEGERKVIMEKLMLKGNSELTVYDANDKTGSKRFEKMIKSVLGDQKIDDAEAKKMMKFVYGSDWEKRMMVGGDLTTEDVSKDFSALMSGRPKEERDAFNKAVQKQKDDNDPTMIMKNLMTKITALIEAIMLWLAENKPKGTDKNSIDASNLKKQ